MSATIPFDVWLNNKLVNTVFYTKDCDEEYVRRSLIDRDCYDPRIVVVKSSLA